MEPKPAPTFDWNELDRVLVERDEKREGNGALGGFTAKDFAKQKGLKAATARKRLHVLESEGIVKVIGKRQFRDRSGRLNRGQDVFDLVVKT